MDLCFVFVSMRGQQLWWMFNENYGTFYGTLVAVTKIIEFGAYLNGGPENVVLLIDFWFENRFQNLSQVIWNLENLENH